jgi:hypothetical protein
MVEEKGRQTADEKEVRKPWTLREFGGKTLWDWMGLLIVPVVLSLITVVFAWQQDIRQDQIEDKRAKAERELAKERAQDEALQAYLDQMSGLLLERDLRTSEKDSEVRTLARARTLTALKRLDPSRKTVVMQFLVEADLVQGVDGREPVISLSGADRGDVNLSGADLHGAVHPGVRDGSLEGYPDGPVAGGRRVYPPRAGPQGQSRGADVPHRGWSRGLAEATGNKRRAQAQGT